MSTILLSGVGGSTNWLPLVFPLVALIVILYLTDFAIKLFRKRKAKRQEHLPDNFHMPIEDFME